MTYCCEYCLNSVLTTLFFFATHTACDLLLRILSKLRFDNVCCSQPVLRVTYCYKCCRCLNCPIIFVFCNWQYSPFATHTSCDLLLRILSKLRFDNTVFFAIHTSCDLLLRILSKLRFDNVHWSQPTLRVTYCCEYCLNFVLTTCAVRNPCCVWPIAARIIYAWTALSFLFFAHWQYSLFATHTACDLLLRILSKLRFDNTVFSQPTRLHLQRSYAWPIATSVVDAWTALSFWVFAHWQYSLTATRTSCDLLLRILSMLELPYHL